MPRQRRLRKVVAPPKFKGYKPFGTNCSTGETVELLYEEYEALKLADYDFMNHAGAAELMGISRPTFARIYESARRKIAKALVEVHEIKAVYGNVVMDKKWYECTMCNARFSIPKSLLTRECPICGAVEIALMNQ